MHKITAVGKCLFGAYLSAAFGVVSAAEPVGTLSRVEGFTSVSQGAQYVKGREGMALKEGDRLMVMEGGSAIVSFADGCRYTLRDNEVLTIGATSTCASDAVGSYKIDPYTAVSQDPSVASAGFQPAALGEVSARGVPNQGWVPAAAAGVIAAVAVAWSDDNSRRTFAVDDNIDLPPASP